LLLHPRYPQLKYFRPRFVPDNSPLIGARFVLCSSRKSLTLSMASDRANINRILGENDARYCSDDVVLPFKREGVPQKGGVLGHALQGATERDAKGKLLSVAPSAAARLRDVVVKALLGPRSLERIKSEGAKALDECVGRFAQQLCRGGRPALQHMCKVAGGEAEQRFRK